MNKRARILLIAAAVIAVALIGLIFIRNLIDFPVYYSAGRSLLAGRTDLYAPDFALGRVMDYRYPPFFLVALIPLWLLSYKAAAYLWYLLSVLQIAGCVAVLRREVNRQGPMKWIWAISFFAVGQYFIQIIHYGNAQLLAIFLLFVSFYLIARRKVAMAALLVAVSITIKLTPLLALPYFALKRQWKYLLLTGFFLLAVNIAPAAYFGFDRNAELLKSWYEKVILDQEFHEVNGPINLSLKGQLRRYFTEVDYTQRIDGDTRYRQINIASLSSDKTDGAWMVIAGGLFLSGMALIWWRQQRLRNGPAGKTKTDEEAREDSTVRERDGNLSPLELGLMICLMLLAGPLTSKIYFIALLWPVISLAGFAFSHSTPAARFGRGALIFIAIANFVLPLLPGSSIQRLLLVIGADFYLNSVLVAALVYVLVSEARALPSLSAEPRTESPSATRTP